MIWWICWISRRTLHSTSPMISSTIQRLLRTICGLFDSGLAGDVDFITSSGLNGPDDALSNFGQDGHTSNLNPRVSGIKNDNNELKRVNSWNVFDELDDLSGDPLGDDSMEAFINLDKFFNGNSFFDEDGNLIIPDEKEAEVRPVINFGPQTSSVVSDSALPTFITQEDDNIFNPPIQTMKTTEKPQRKRSARGAIKTSLYEIPATSIIPDIVGDSLQHSAIDTELDHDYSSKRQRMSSVSEIVTSTSGAMKSSTQGREDTSTPILTSDSVADLSMGGSVDKQTVRRIKNNHASKRSREQRKQKFVDMDVEADELILKNQELREKIVRLEELAKEMKQVLVAKMSGKSA